MVSSSFDSVERLKWQKTGIIEFERIYLFKRKKFSSFRQKITNKKQFQLMIGMLEENPAAAKGLKFAESANFGRDQYTEVWNEIAAKLNSAGPPTRKIAEWQKVCC